MRTWSSYQLAVFDDVARGTKHTVVRAVAGSGKTTTIEAAVDHVPAGKSAMFVAFNKSIAEELALRLQGKRVEVSTLHSYGLKCVTRALGRLVIDSRRVDDFARQLPGDPRTVDQVRDLCRVVSLCKGSLASTEAEVDAIVDAYGADTADGYGVEGGGSEGGRDRFARDVLSLLERCSGTEDGRLDFDDMIWLPVVLGLPQRQFDRVIGDEIQDFNACQIELMLRAIRPGGRFLGVGDDRQAIYKFRGADENAFDRVKSRLQATELPLSICYRCSAAVVQQAQEIVPGIEPAPGAEEGEVRDASYREMYHALQPGDVVLSRTNAPLVSICLALLAEGRRATVAGRDIGAQLAGFVEKIVSRRRKGGWDVEALRTYVEQWAAKECARLAAKGRDTQSVEDRAACVLAISDGAASVRDVLRRIESLFGEDSGGGSRITLSSTHKAKGLEWDRVWMLRSTYMRRPDVEESNLAYVAVTRAKRELVLVRGLP